MRIAIFGSYGQGNIGDEAIADGIAKIMKQAVPGTTLVLFSHQSSSINEKHSGFETIRPMIASGLRSLWHQLNNGEWHTNMQVLKTCDWIMIGGGGIFHDQEIGQKGLSPLFIWWLRTILFKLLGKKIAIVAVGIGPIKHRLSYWWLKGILKRAEIITVRDENSEIIAKGLTTKTITILPDPVWGLLPAPKSKSTSGTLGINIRANHRFPNQELVKRLINIIDSITPQIPFKNILLVPFAFHNPDDRELMNEVASIIATHTHVPVTIATETSIEDIYHKVAHLDYFIATRFHSYIFATSADTPCALLSYSDKTDQISKHKKVYYLEQQKLATAFWHQKLQVD